jgi:lysophospholipase L1-like esterase
MRLGVSLVLPVALCLLACSGGGDSNADAPRLRIVAIGDSVMVGATADLEREVPGIEIHALEGRQFEEGLAVVQELRDEAGLGDIVVIDLGTNGPITRELVDEMLALLEGVDRVVFVNLRMPRSWEAGNNAILSETSARYGNVALVDWHEASDGHPEYFWDGVHLTPDGAHAFALLVSGEIED